MLDELTNLDTLVPDVMRAAVVFDKSIPASMALSDLARSAAEFARRTLVLTDEWTICTQHCVPDYLLPCAPGVTIYHITEARHGCRRLHGLSNGYARPGHRALHWRHEHLHGYYFEPATNTIHLGTGPSSEIPHEHPGPSPDLWLRVVLVPDGLSDTVPAALLADGEWRDAIIAGAIATMAELHAPQRASYWREKFNAAVGRAVLRRVTNYSSTDDARMRMVGRRFIRR